MKRVLIVLLAFVLAGIGGVSVLAYARAADQRALAGQETVEVYVSTAEVPAGTTAKDAVDTGLLKTTLVAEKGAPEGALTAVTEDMADQVAMSAISPGEIVLARRFGTQATDQAALVVPEGMVAVTVQLTDPGKVGPFLRPGSQIAIYDSFTARDPENDDLSPNGELGLPGGEGKVNVTRALIPKTEVLAVGALTGTTVQQPSEDGTAAPADQAPSALVTVAVTPADSQRLVHGAQTGSLYSVLLGSGAEVPGGIVEDRQLFGNG